MQSLSHTFDELTVARAWPVFVTCSGEVEVHYSRNEWWIGSVTLNCFRYGDHVETVTYIGSHPRAERIRALILNDAGRCRLIDEQIEGERSEERLQADEARYDMRREAAI